MREFSGRRASKTGHVLSCIFLVFFLSGPVVQGFAEEISAPPPPEAAGHVVSGSDDSNGADIIFEEPLNKDEKPSSTVLPEPDNCLQPQDSQELPRIAIIIDDMGHHKKYGGELLDLDLNLTFSFLPHAPFTNEQDEHAWRLGRDILVHMPMEPRDPKFDPGPGTIYLGESEKDIVKTVQENIKLIPHAIGVNNHMGSRFTEDRQAMREVLQVLKRENLFFVDSVTTPDSVGAEVASRMGVKTGRRIIFLDNSQNKEDICRQLKRLVAYAKKHGSGIGIGHPNRATANALRECRDTLLKQVRIVGIHELVR